MGLKDLNVSTLLNEQIGIYLRDRVTYADLRTKCLTIAPIQPIVDPLVQRINDTAEQDKEQKKRSLTQDAHLSQVRQDADEQGEDGSIQSRCNRNKESLTHL